MANATLNEDIDRLGETALRIAQDRNDLLKALRDTINAVDRHGGDGPSYAQARHNAVELLTRLK